MLCTKCGMSTLHDYLSSRSISQKAFADAAGVDKSIISRLVRGEIRPSLDLAFAIERLTGREVLAESWSREKPQEAAE
jgi:transcriptional regulator with XRE-family HTH domain